MCASLLCAVRFGLGWAHDVFLLHITCSCIPMHRSFFSISFFLYWTVWVFSVCFSFSFPLSMVALVVSMAPKRKSIPSQNPLRSKGSSSLESTPLSVRFCDEKAHKDFSENFSKRGVHSERHVVLADFADTDLPTVIHSRGWESLCDVPVTCPLVLIQEFYSNIHGIDSSVPLFYSRVRGTRFAVTPKLVSEVLHVPRVDHPDYPSCERL